MVLKGSKQRIQILGPTFLWVSPNTEFWLRGYVSSKFCFSLNSTNSSTHLTGSLEFFSDIKKIQNPGSFPQVLRLLWRTASSRQMAELMTLRQFLAGNTRPSIGPHGLRITTWSWKGCTSCQIIGILHSPPPSLILLIWKSLGHRLVLYKPRFINCDVES